VPDAPVKTVENVTEIASMLDRGQIQHALASITHTGQDTPPWRIARGVCLLRMGRLDDAARLFADLVFPGGGVIVPEDTPSLYIANFITAMLLKRNLASAIPLLEHLRSDGHPYVTQLLQAAQQWRRSLTRFQRFRCYIGWYPNVALSPPSPPGGL
jgi:hypothetical protein